MGPAKSVGQQTKLFDWPSGYSDWEAPGGGPAPSEDGAWYFAPIRRNSDSARGGLRINLLTGEAGPFRIHPVNDSDDNRRSIIPTGPLGTWGFFTHARGVPPGHPTDWQAINMVTGARGSTVLTVASHPDYYLGDDGAEYGFGMRSGTWRSLKLSTSQLIVRGNEPSASVEHACCRGWNDTFPGGGHRYALCSISSPGSGAGILGLRLGTNDTNQWRYICNHRSVRSENTSECHPQQSPDWKYVAFNSNWNAPGVATSNDVSTYIVIIPDAWYIPNNGGS